MKVIRQISYEGPEDKLRDQLARSMPDGIRRNMNGGVAIEVRTVYSELPELPPFVPVEEPNFFLKDTDVKEFLMAMKEQLGTTCEVCGGAGEYDVESVGDNTEIYTVPCDWCASQEDVSNNA
jgi:hypothetical protein